MFPPHAVSRLEQASAEEKTLALMCKRALEMDVPEAMARMIAEAENEPWDYYVDMCRQLWDEARHAMMGEVYFEHNGVSDWREKIALHVGFSMTLNQRLTALEAHSILYMIEQGLMPATTGKKYEWNVSKEARDPLATIFQDYDWADEVLHTHIGRRWLVPKFSGGRDAVIALAEQKRLDYAEFLQSKSDQAATGELVAGFCPGGTQPGGHADRINCSTDLIRIGADGGYNCTGTRCEGSSSK